MLDSDVTSAETDSKSENILPMSLSSSCGSSTSPSTSWRTSPLLKPARPTEEEASALWEIMSTPPQTFKVCAQDMRHRTKQRRDDFRCLTRSQSFPSSSILYDPYDTSALVSPRSISTSNSYESSYGPPYESSLPHKPTPRLSLQPATATGKKYSLWPRSSLPPKRSYNQNQTLSQHCLQYGMGPFLSLLPESIVYSIIAYIDYFDRHPTLLLVSRGMTKLLTRPEFLLEMKHSHEKSRECTKEKRGLRSHMLDEEDFEEERLATSNEMLLVVGGKCPTKASSNSFNDSDHRGGHIQSTNAEHHGGSRMNRRMAMQNNEDCGIMAYDPRRKRWLRFGGDPSGPWTHNESANASLASSSNETLHPLSPFGILGAKPLYVGHPYYSLLFFGGTHYETGKPSSRVIAYSFLSGMWECWPDMMRPRHGDDFVVVRVEGSQEQQEGLARSCYCNDSIVLIGCDMELCDCFRCNPPPCSSDQDGTSDMNIDLISFVHSGSGDAGTTSDCNLIDNSQRTKKADFDSMGRCEVLDLKSRLWQRRQSRAPSCPPDDGGVAVIGGRYVYLPGTCPPPPSTSTSYRQVPEDGSTTDYGEAAEVVTPLTQSEVNSRTERSKSMSSSTSMDTGSEPIGDDGIIPSPLGNLFRSLSYRPGLRYDCWLDQWTTLPSRPYITTSSPTTCSFRGHVLVLGGYRSSSENALSCYRHREEDSILDYEDHLDYVWWYLSLSKPSNNNYDGENSNMDILHQSIDDDGEWTFGGGSTMFGHRQSWAHSSDMAAAVAAASSLMDDMKSANHDSSLNLPCVAPVSVRGGTATTYQGRLTMLGGLSTFSRTFYDSNRQTIFQFFPEHREWRKAPMTLPIPALLNGYAFSIHI